MFKTFQKVNLHSRPQTHVEGSGWKLPLPPDSSFHTPTTIRKEEMREGIWWLGLGKRDQ